MRMKTMTMKMKLTTRMARRASESHSEQGGLLITPSPNLFLVLPN
jgi:hypothetical protein